MHRLAYFGNLCDGKDRLRKKLQNIFEIDFQPLESCFGAELGHYTVFDFDLNNTTHLVQLKDKLKTKPKDAKVVFVVERASRLQETRALALGATDIVHRPLDARALLIKLWGEFGSAPTEAIKPVETARPDVTAATETLRGIFSAALSGAAPDAEAIQAGGDAVVDQVEAQGLAAWIDTVRAYHSQTYQHCLLVTGLAVAFGQQLGVSRADRQRLSFAGMLHDIGKARIPIAILEKPGPLDAEEMAVMRKHPLYGLDALATVSGLPSEMLDMVVHHHEYLDGSGYPHGLMAGEISDLVRMVTIADVFGALIERRSYKAPLSGEAAYQILLDMGPKLDKDLVREFRAVARLGR